MPEKARAERTELTDWPVPPASTPTSDFYEDEAYTQPVKQNDASMIQLLAARARKSNS